MGIIPWKHIAPLRDSARIQPCPPIASSAILSSMTRRQALAAPLAAVAFSAGARPDPQPGPQPSPRFIKGICSVIFPKELPRPECFVQAKSAGFDAIELSIGPDFPLDIGHDDARRMADAADKAGIRIATLWISEALHQNPLNAADPAVRARGVEAIRRAIAIAADMNCGAVLPYALTLGQRIKRIHFKDFKLGGREPARFADLLEGDVNWKAVMAALVKAGYRGFISPEIGRNPSQADQLKQVSAALDKILAMA